jgi:hypothetical protein
MKVAVWILIICFISSSAFAMTVTEPATLEKTEMAIEPATATIQEGEIFTVTVKARLARGAHANQVWAKILYPDTVDVLSAEMDPLFEDWFGTGVDISTEGSVSFRKQYFGVADSGATGTFEIGNITFSNDADVNSTVDLHFTAGGKTKLVVGTEDKFTNGKRAILTVVADPEPREPDVSVPTAAPADGCGDIDGDGFIRQRDITTLAAVVSSGREIPERRFYTFDVTGDDVLNRRDVSALTLYKDGELLHLSCTSPPATCGDLNTDGEVTEADVNQLESALSSPAMASELLVTVADINGDGGVTPADLETFKSYFASGAVGNPCVGSTSGRSQFLTEMGGYYDEAETSGWTLSLVNRIAHLLDSLFS